MFTWVWCLHLLSLTLCPSPDTTCFYYNSIIPLVLIKYSVCSKPSSHQKWIQPHLCLWLSVLLFFPFTAFWSCLLSFCLSHFSTHLACVRHVYAWHAFMPDALFWFCCLPLSASLSMPHLAIIMQKIPAHSIPIKCANATFFCHHVVYATSLNMQC